MKSFFWKLVGFLTLIFYIPAQVFAQEISELGEVEDFGDLVSKIWSWGFVVILSLSVMMMVIGGILYMTSSGNEERLEKAREVMSGSLIASGIVLFSGVIQKVLRRPTEVITESGKTISLNELPIAIQNATNVLLTLIGGIAILMLIVSGYQYATSRGDTEKLDRAKKGIFYAMIGLAISISAFLILNTFVDIFSS